MPSPLRALRKLCLSLPDAHEVEAWGAPTFRVKNKLFAMYAQSGNSHTDGRASVWIKANKANQLLMIRAQPDRYFKPPYVGPSGWVGVYLDDSPDWDEVAALLFDGWKLTAPKRLIAKHEQRATGKNEQRATTRQKQRATTRPKRGRS